MGSPLRERMRNKLLLQCGLSGKLQSERLFCSILCQGGGHDRDDIELINAPFLHAGGTPAEYRAGIERAVAKGWLWQHESGVYVKFTPAGAELFA